MENEIWKWKEKYFRNFIRVTEITVSEDIIIDVRE